MTKNEKPAASADTQTKDERKRLWKVTYHGRQQTVYGEVQQLRAEAGPDLLKWEVDHPTRGVRCYYAEAPARLYDGLEGFTVEEVEDPREERDGTMPFAPSPKPDAIKHGLPSRSKVAAGHKAPGIK